MFLCVECESRPGGAAKDLESFFLFVEPEELSKCVVPKKQILGDEEAHQGTAAESQNQHPAHQDEASVGAREVWRKRLVDSRYPFQRNAKRHQKNEERECCAPANSAQRYMLDIAIHDLTSISRVN